MECEILGRNQAHGEFSGVKRDVNFGIDAVQVINHRYVLVEVVDGDVPVLGLDKVHADEAGIGGGQFEAEQQLGEDDFRAQSTERVRKITDGDGASGSGVWGSALENFFGAGIVGGEALAGIDSDLFHAGGEEGVARLGVIGIPLDFSCEKSGATGVGGVHEFDVLQMVQAGAIGGGSDAFGGVVVRGQPEFVEGGEEMIVTRFVARLPVAHRPGVDHLAVEHVIDIRATGRGFGSVGFAGIARRGEEVGGGAVDAEVAGGGEIDEVLRVDCAVEVVVEVSTFGQVADEGQEESGLFANGIEVAGGALLGALGRGEGGEKK